MVTRHRIESAREKIANAKSAIDAAERSLDMAEQAVDVAGGVKSNWKRIAAFFLLLTVIGVVYLVMNDQKS